MYTVSGFSLDIVETSISIKGVSLGFSRDLDGPGYGLLGRDILFAHRMVLFREKYLEVLLSEYTRGA